MYYWKVVEKKLARYLVHRLRVDILQFHSVEFIHPDLALSNILFTALMEWHRCLKHGTATFYCRVQLVPFAFQFGGKTINHLRVEVLHLSQAIRHLEDAVNVHLKRNKNELVRRKPRLWNYYVSAFPIQSVKLMEADRGVVKTSVI